MVAIAEVPSGANAEHGANTGGIFVLAALEIAAPISKRTHMTLDCSIKTIVIELLKLSRSPDGLRNQAILLIDPGTVFLNE
jgi:hypothetical protein